MADSYRDHCRDCIHFTPWPERAERVREVFGLVPMGHPVNACMADPVFVLPISPSDSPANPSSAAAGCSRFERGKRSKYIKEVVDKA